MTATDKAFIRVFDSHADVAALAPHVSFATRGVPIPAAAISDVLHQGSSQPNDAASTEHDARPAARPVAAAAARSPMARPAPPPPRKQQAAATSAPTYLPSAFRQRTGPVEPGT